MKGDVTSEDVKTIMQERDTLANQVHELNQQLSGYAAQKEVSFEMNDHLTFGAGARESSKRLLGSKA
jgi:hypothetical protein